MAITDAAESLAQNKPSGLEKEAIKTDKGAELVEVSIKVQKASFQHNITLKRKADENMTGNPVGIPVFAEATELMVQMT